MKEKIAIIDLGSNSVRMNIIELNEVGGYTVFDQAKEMVRLSEGLDTDGFLKTEPMERTIKALDYFKRLLESNQVTTIYPLATAAVRMAKNQQFFLEKVKREAGFDFRVLSGHEEAYYDYLGVVNSMTFQDALLVDIGGGSTEIVWVENRKIKNAISLPVGSVILTERFKPVNGNSKKNPTDAAEKYFNKLLKEITWLEETKGLPVIGLGGIIRTIAKIDRDLNKYPIDNMHNYHIDAVDAFSIFDLIHSTDAKDLGKISGISKKRIDLMAIGIVPLKTVMKAINAPDLRISGNGLREGFFYTTYFTALNLPVVVENVLKHSKDNMMKRYSANIPHALHVKKLSLKLFDILKPIHEFSDDDRKLLGIAATLHDIGMHIEYYDHHIHGMYLLLNSRIDGLTNLELASVAFLVGNHRESSIKERTKDFERFVSKADLNKLMNLSILLQIAEQLDRTETAVIKNLATEIYDDVVYIKVVSDYVPQLDIDSAMRFSDRFEKVFNRKLNIYC